MTLLLYHDACIYFSLKNQLSITPSKVGGVIINHGCNPGTASLLNHSMVESIGTSGTISTFSHSNFINNVCTNDLKREFNIQYS